MQKGCSGGLGDNKDRQDWDSLNLNTVRSLKLAKEIRRESANYIGTCSFMAAIKADIKLQPIRQCQSNGCLANGMCSYKAVWRRCFIGTDIKGHRCREGTGCRTAKPTSGCTLPHCLSWLYRPESSAGLSRHQQIGVPGTVHQYRRSERTAGDAAGLKGFPDAINTVYPEACVQLCIVHMECNSLRFVSWKDDKAVTRDLKAIYQLPMEEADQQALEASAAAKDSRYPQVSRILPRSSLLLFYCIIISWFAENILVDAAFINSLVLSAYFLSKTSMLPFLSLMECALPYLLSLVITGNSELGNLLWTVPPRFLLFSLHYVCGEIPVFQSSYIPHLALIAVFRIIKIMSSGINGKILLTAFVC